MLSTTEQMIGLQYLSNSTFGKQREMHCALHKLLMIRIQLKSSVRTDYVPQLWNLRKSLVKPVTRQKTCN